MNKVIVLTGGSGYIGKNIIAGLLEKGFRVANIDIESYFPQDPLLDLGHNYINIYSDLTQDVSKPIQEISEFAKDDIIYGLIHLASWKDLPGSHENPYEYYRNNIGSTINVIQLAYRLQVRRFIFSSSAAVYADNVEGAVQEWQAIELPSSPYGVTKFVNERILLDSLRSMHIPCICLRYCNPMGIYKNINVDSSDSMFGNIYNALKHNTTFTIFGNDYETPDGTPIRDYIDIEDVVNAHLHFLNPEVGKYGVINNIVNVGSGKGTSCLEVCKLVQKVYPDFKYEFGSRREGDAPGSYADTAILKDYGFECKIPLEDSLKKLFDYIKVHNDNI